MSNVILVQRKEGQKGQRPKVTSCLHGAQGADLQCQGYHQQTLRRAAESGRQPEHRHQTVRVN